MDPTTQLLLGLSRLFRISPEAASTWIPLGIIFANRLAKLIPDNATGVLGVLRTICSVLGLHVQNNTGVAPVLDTTGKQIQRSEAEPGVEPEGIIPVAPEPAPVIRDMFAKGANAIAEKDSTHEG